MDFQPSMRPQSPSIRIVIELISQVVGEVTINIILANLNSKQQPEENTHIMLDIAEELSQLFGHEGAFAILRESGRRFAEIASSDAPDSHEVSTALRALQLAHSVTIEGQMLSIQSCSIYPLISARGYEPEEHPGCWLEKGVLEGYIKAIGLDCRHLQLTGRNRLENQCEFSCQKTA